MSYAKHLKEHILLGTPRNALGNNLKAVWYRLRHTSGATIKDSLSNGPDLTLNGTTAAVWNNDGWATPAGDNYPRVIGNAYINDLFDIPSLLTTGGVLFFTADIYPAVNNPDNTQTIFQWGGGTGTPGANNTSIALTQHTTTGTGRLRVQDDYALWTAETAQLSATTRATLAGYVDTTNELIGISVNGGAFTTQAIDLTSSYAEWDHAAASARGLCLFAINPTTVGGTPTVFMGGGTGAGTRASGLFICKFQTHPGADLLLRLSKDFYANAGKIPEDLLYGMF